MSITPDGGWAVPSQDPHAAHSTPIARLQHARTPDRWIVGTLLLIALLTFFLPLASLQLPILGSQDFSGYDLMNKGREINQAVSSFGNGNAETPRVMDLEHTEDKSAIAANPSLEIPASIRYVSLVAIEIGLAFGCAVLALICCVSAPSQAATRVLSVVGGLAALAATLHLTIANSDMHSWLHQQLSATATLPSDNPFSGLTQQLETLAANAVQLKPGAGLYVLTATLMLASVILVSKILSPAGHPTLQEPSPVSGVTFMRKAAGIGLLITGVMVGVVVGRHYLTSPPNAPNAITGEFKMSKALSVVYGNYDPATKSSVVHTKNMSGESSPGHAIVILDSTYVQKSIRKHLLVTSAAADGEDCHACGAQVDAFVFSQTQRGWTAEIVDNDIAQTGAFGSAGKALAVLYGSDVHGFEISLEDGGQGITNANEVFIAPVSDHFRPVLSLTTESDNLGSCGSTDTETEVGHDPCAQTKSVVRFMKSIHQGFFDIAVQESGTAIAAQGLVRTDGRKLYEFDGGKYAEILQ
ncbi:hypothetical protein [Granulicella paludicola]|uniref:hypothetical protein n=1 Tax=Granulicella paludicola TaxID=474951 RepID=UPI0021DFE5AF|nr:hypothetical protein [Granulicella paludicola]